MTVLRFVDVTDLEAFGRMPPCADPRFDHRTCDYWEDADRGTKAARPSWLEATPPRAPATRQADPPPPENPFAPVRTGPAENPFAPPVKRGTTDALAALAGDDLPTLAPGENPFAATRHRERPLRDGVPRKLALLDRGRGVFGSYGKTALADETAVGWCQFGPLSAYPRALRLRDLYPQLPDAPLPAVITCIATTADARRRGYARQLVLAVCDDLAARGFAAVEAYPDLTRDEDEQSGGRPALWEACGFAAVVDDPRFPVYRRELE